MEEEEEEGLVGVLVVVEEDQEGVGVLVVLEDLAVALSNVSGFFAAAAGYDGVVHVVVLRSVALEALVVISQA